ncbi:MAG: hypothetical protein PHQ19_02355 [Candidatus Krumholzibacteria bacterium]|nr:hypothetical protein [Candidatus Krumholzibacteria bacterium]
MRRPLCAVLLAASLAVLLVSCQEDEDTYEYFEYSYIDTVLAADTIANGQSVDIVFYYPAGCNRFERFETEERGDTLDVSVLFLFYFYGMPCAHGDGYETKSYPLHFSAEGPWRLHYRRGAAEWADREIFVR